jgi:NAD(P)H-dependent FMN reductase
MLKVGLIVGSTRPNRFADTPVRWLLEGSSARSDLRLTVLDLRDYRLPFLQRAGGHYCCALASRNALANVSRSVLPRSETAQ